MKDFYDVARLAQDVDFDGVLLACAIQATFERRGTPLPLTTPNAISADFAADAGKRTQWAAFVRKAGASDAGTLSGATEAMRRFLAEPLEDVARGA